MLVALQQSEVLGGAFALNTPNVGLHEPPAPSIYVPYTVMLSDSLNVILRTSRDALAMTRSIREAVRTVDSNQPVSVHTPKARWHARAGPVSGL